MIKDFPIYEQITQPHLNHLFTFYDNICDNKQKKFLIPFAFIFFILSYILYIPDTEFTPRSIGSLRFYLSKLFLQILQFL